MYRKPPYVVVLTEYADALVVEQSDLPRPLEFQRGAEPKMTIGHHDRCEGLVRIMRSSVTHSVVVCERCCLRIPFPKNQGSIGDIMVFFATRARQHGWQPPMTENAVPYEPPALQSPRESPS